jgi:hypothetical protein
MRHLAALAAALATTSQLAGCLLPGGCGAPADPQVPTYLLNPVSAATAPAQVNGIAASAGGGVWLLETATDGSHAIVRYDRAGGVEQQRIALGSDPVFGLAADGNTLWYGHTQGSITHADQIDAATGAELGFVDLPPATTDLAWNGTDLVAVQGVDAIEEYDPSSSALVASVPVQQLGALVTVAVDGYDTWVAQPGPLALVYGSDGILSAKVQTDAFEVPSAHMAFIGGQLLVAHSAEIDMYTVDKSATATAQ